MNGKYVDFVETVIEPPYAKAYTERTNTDFYSLSREEQKTEVADFIIQILREYIRKG